MSESQFFAALGTVLYVLIHLAVMMRAILRPHREPASRLAWVVVIIVVPVLGIIGYILLGETNIGRRRVARMRKVLAGRRNARRRELVDWLGGTFDHKAFDLDEARQRLTEYVEVSMPKTQSVV